MNEYGYNAKEISPPVDRKFLAQIINDFGCFDLEWYEMYFDSKIVGEKDLGVFDENDNYVGEIWFWKELGEVK